MSSFDPTRRSRLVAILTAWILFFTAAESTFAKNGGNSNNHNTMRSSNANHDSGKRDKLTKKHKAKDETKVSAKAKTEVKVSDRQNHKDKDKTPVAMTTSANVKPPAPGTGGTNTIHPIVSSAPGTVTISNGVTKIDIQNGAGGVTVSSSSPGTITVSNGKESKTLSGASLTLSGNVIGVGAAKGIQVGAPNGEGKTVVAVNSAAPAPGNYPQAQGIGPKSITVTGGDVKTAAKLNAVTTAGAIATAGVLPIATTAAAIGYVKGGVTGAYNSASSAVSRTVDFIKAGFGSWW